MLRRTVLTKEPPVQTPEYKKAFWDKLHEGNHVTVILKDGDVVDEHENVRVLKNDAGVLCATINKRLVPFGDTFYRLLPATKSSEATQRMDRTEALDYAAAKNGDGRLSYALCDDLTSFFSVYTTNVSEEASVLTLFYYTRTGFYWFSGSYLPANNSELAATLWQTAFERLMNNMFPRVGAPSYSVTYSGHDGHQGNGAGKRKNGRRRNNNAPQFQAKNQSTLSYEQAEVFRNNMTLQIDQITQAARQELIMLLGNEQVEEGDHAFETTTFKHYTSKKVWKQVFYLPVQLASLYAARSKADITKSTAILTEFNKAFNGQTYDVEKMLETVRKAA